MCSFIKTSRYIERIIVAALVLQDDVMGASSELSLSCISLSGEWSKGIRPSFSKNSPFTCFILLWVWVEWREMETIWRLQPLSSSTHPHILRTPEHHNFSPSPLFPQSFSQSGSSKMIVQSSPTCLRARCSAAPVLAFPFPSFASSLASSSRISRLPQSNADIVFPDGTSESFYSCLTSNTADDTYIFSHPFQSLDYIWQPGDDDIEDKMIFYSQQSCSCSSNTIYTDFAESERNGEENQLETNVSCQQTITELAREQCGDVHTGVLLTDVSSVPTKHTGKGKCSVPHLTCVGAFT